MTFCINRSETQAYPNLCMILMLQFTTNIATARMRGATSGGYQLAYGEYIDGTLAEICDCTCMLKISYINL
jgi:hypothetical protein